MAFVRDMSLGAGGFWRAFGFVNRHGLWWMYLVPILLWLLLAFGLYHALDSFVDQVELRAAAYLRIPVETQEQGVWADTKAFLNGASVTIVSWGLRLALGYLLFVANKYIVLVLLSPLLAYASEVAEEKLTGRVYPFSWRQLLKDALRGALIATRNGVLELSLSFIIWVLTILFPLISPLSVVVLFLVSAYFYGFSMFDYVFERRRMRIGETTRAVNGRLGAVLANGVFFGLLLKVPLVGIMLAPVMASVGAVLATVDKDATAVAPR